MTATTTSPYAWVPSPEQIRASRIRGFVDSLGLADLEEVQRFAIADPERFWTAVADDIGLEWSSRFTQAIDTSPGIEWTRFWVGGRLNLAALAVDRWAQRTPDKEAIVWEGDDGAVRRWSYAELHGEVQRAGAALRSLGVGAGDAVGLCMPMMPETAALFLACARIGAVVAPLFSGYGAPAIVSRLRDCDAKVLCIADGFLRRGGQVDLKATADSVAADVPSLRHVLVVRRLGRDVTMHAPRDRWYHELQPDVATTAEPADTAADSPLMVIYTSGTTGRPKGTLHVHGGFPVKAAQDIAHCFDVGAADRVMWFTDIGWMMGPWVICGALMHGATLVLFEGTPDHPGPDRLWSVVERHRVSVLGVAPTVVRALMPHGDEPVRSHDLGSLRVLGSSGEPWNTEPWLWFQRVAGRGQCPVINYSGGTEVSGGILGCTMLRPLRPGAFSSPVPGMAADVVDEHGRSVRGAVGELVVRAPWPGMTQGFWRDPDRYLETYWSRFDGVWVHGDWAEVDGDGQWYIRGRSDDTLKIAGKRLGPAEVESALVAHPAVAEAAAIGVPDAVKGEALVAFVVLKAGVTDGPDLRRDLARRVSDDLGKALAPKAVEIVSELPKTRNAKVLRRVVRAVYLGSDPGDLTSLENRSAIDAIQALRTS
ncbi:MAG: AMP-binding protein [Candidatus Dormibacteraeota bacterium]|nr:AMP-binding protein [Candidatus Dormibacteraeota bacterium]